jgi:glycosyltransferase involved in cell wall biosynthesis
MSERTKRSEHPGGRILMIVANPCVNDTRVIKEAETLVAAGHVVRVVCQKAPGVPDAQTINGVEYVRLPMGLSPPAINRYVMRTWQFVYRAYIQFLRWLRGTFFGEAVKALSTDLRSTGQSIDENGAAQNKAGGYSIRLMGLVANTIQYVWRSLMRLRLTIHQILRVVFRHRSMYAVTATQAADFSPDIIHAHDLLPLPAAVRCARADGIKVVYDSHELECHRNGLGFLGRRMAHFQERRNIGRTALVITVCNSIADHLAHHYLIPRPVVVMNAPSTLTPDDGGSTIRSDLGLPESQILAVYVGKITINRGLEQLVEALTHCKDVHLAMLGPKHLPTENNVRALAVQRQVDSRLHILDSVAPNAVVSYISSADVGVIPTQDVCLSYRYSLPNKLFEMTFAGLPVCVSDLPEQRAFIQKAGNGLVMDETDPRDISRAILETYERRADLSPSANQLSELMQEYSWDAQAQVLLDAYGDLVETG